MFTNYFKLLRLYSRLETAVETHSKKLKSLKKQIREYLIAKNDIVLKKIISNIEQLDYERRVIEKMLTDYSKMTTNASSFNNLIEAKNTLEILDDIHALLDYFGTVALKTEYMLLRYLEKLSHEDYLVNQYIDLIDHNKEHVKSLKRRLNVFLNKLEDEVKELVEKVEDEELVKDFLKNLSFPLKRS